MNTTNDQLPPPSTSNVPDVWMASAGTLREKAGARITDDAWRRVWVGLLTYLEQRGMDLPAALLWALHDELG